MLSLLGAVRLLFPDIPDMLWVPVASLLVIYILVWLFITYRYRGNLKEDPVSPSSGGAGERADSSLTKLAKKKIKAEQKAAKKKI